jgi:hypothetical protein
MLRLSASVIPLKLAETRGIDCPLKASWPGGLLDRWETTSMASKKIHVEDCQWSNLPFCGSLLAAPLHVADS